MRVSKVNELFKCRTLTAGQWSVTLWRGMQEFSRALWERKGQGRNGWRGWRRSNAGEEKTNKEKKRLRERGDKQKKRPRGMG